MSVKLDGALAAGLGILGLGLLGWGYWPSTYATEGLTVDLTDFGTPPGHQLDDPVRMDPHQQYPGTVSLEYPQRIRAGDVALVRLQIAPQQSAIPGRPPDGLEWLQKPTTSIYEGAPQPALIQSRLELSGMEVFPEGDITSPWLIDAGAAFVWRVRASASGSAQGTAWIFVLPTASSDLAAHRIALTAQPFRIENASLLGVSGPAARAVGAVAILLAVILGLSTMDRLLRQAKPRWPPHREQ